MNFRIRVDKRANYKGVFFNGKTMRQRLDIRHPIETPLHPEIEDVAINNKCNGGCSYCYTSALRTGSNFTDIVKKAEDVWGSLSENERPFQIAIGGAGESTMHPDWVSFVDTVHGLGIMPNYTTNAMHLSQEILDATREFCGGVAVSFHPHLEDFFNKGVLELSDYTEKLNAHFIIGDKKSIDDLWKYYDRYKDVIEYFVLLPYQAVGRAKSIEVEDNWSDLFRKIEKLEYNEQRKFAFGALFYNWFLKNPVDLSIDMYEPEMFSGYRIFDDSYQVLRRSSYDLREKVVQLENPESSSVCL